MADKMTKQQKQEARIQRQTEQLKKMQANQQRRAARPHRGLLPQSWNNKYALIVIVIAAIVLNLFGKVTVTPTDTELDIKAFCVSTAVSYADITAIDYYDADLSGKLYQGRVSGFLSLDTLKVKGGTFNRGDILKLEKYSGFSSYQLYSDGGYKGDYVILTVLDPLTETEILYLIGAKTVDTRLLYQQLKQSVEL